MNITYNIIYNTKPGFVIRVALILERRAYEIQSLEVYPSEKNGCSEMLLKVNGSPEKSEQIVKQIAKLIDVIYIEEEKIMEYSHA